MSDRFVGFGQPRAFACVVREGDPRQLLVFDHPASGEAIEEDWCVWLFDAPRETPESWIHIPDEEALRFTNRWLPLDARASSVVHTYLSEVVEMTIASADRIEQMFGDDKPDG